MKTKRPRGAYVRKSNIVRKLFPKAKTIKLSKVDPAEFWGDPCWTQPEEKST